MWWLDPGQQLSTHQPLTPSLPSRIGKRIERAKARSWQFNKWRGKKPSNTKANHSSPSMSLLMSSQSPSNSCFGRLPPAPSWFYCWAWHCMAQTLWSMEVSHPDCVMHPASCPPPGYLLEGQNEQQKVWHCVKIWQQPLKPWCAINAILVSEQQHYTTLPVLHGQWRELTSFQPDLVHCMQRG